MDIHTTCQRRIRWSAVVFLLTATAFAQPAHTQTSNLTAWCSAVETPTETPACISGPFGGCETDTCRSAIREFYKTGSIDLHNNALKACSPASECPSELSELTRTAEQWSEYLASPEGYCPDLKKFQDFRVPQETACRSPSTSAIRSRLIEMRCSAYLAGRRCDHPSSCPPVAVRCGISSAEAEKVKNRRFAFCGYAGDQREPAVSLFVCPRFAAAEDEADCGASLAAARERKNNKSCVNLKLIFNGKVSRWNLGPTHDLQVAIATDGVLDDHCLFVSTLDGSGCKPNADMTLFSPLVAAERGQTSIDNAVKTVSRILFFGCEQADKECKHVVGWSAEKQQGSEAFAVTPFTGPAGDLFFSRGDAMAEDAARRSEEAMQLRRVLLVRYQTAAFGPPPMVDRDRIRDCAWLGEPADNPVLCWEYATNARARNFRTWRPFSASIQAGSLSEQQKAAASEWTAIIRDASEKLNGPAFIVAGSNPAGLVIFSDGSKFVGSDGRGALQVIDGQASSWLTSIMAMRPDEAAPRLEWFRVRWPFQIASLAKDKAPSCWIKRLESGWKLTCGALGSDDGAAWSPIDDDRPPEGFDRLVEVAGTSDYELFTRIATAGAGVRVKAFHKLDGEPALAFIQVQSPDGNGAAWISNQKDGEHCTAVTMERQLGQNVSDVVHDAAGAQIAAHRAGARSLSLHPVDRNCLRGNQCKTIAVAPMITDSAIWMGSSSTNPEKGWRLVSVLQKMSRDFGWFDESNSNAPFMTCLTKDDLRGECGPFAKDLRLLLLPLEESKIVDLSDMKLADFSKHFSSAQCPVSH